ncbi:MAG: Trp family transcriptional regulator [Candidatus Taylorbacteria bacterium]|nr:Trp family transcriptional regulator [Candidatus Taylorbacteria bacterium]
MKINSEKLKKETKEKLLDILYAALDHAKSQNEVKSFINDILTESEKIMLGRRILIAKRLLEKQSYPQIAREVGVGFDTIFKVKNWLGGRHRGYKKVVEKFDKIIRSKTKSGFRDYYPSGPFADLKRRYKSYYWLSNLLDEVNRD